MAEASGWPSAQKNVIRERKVPQLLVSSFTQFLNYTFSLQPRIPASGSRLQAPGSSHVKESIKIRFVIVARGEASSLPLNLNSGPQI
ncbi:unnamed protein product [Prunus armeniaca]|uniref:Uncharacterized protein n=1 Tax=Prunus armeniaca TaxID=36596 RepID=A0A6J5UB75_PRUAR|nr:unnamed protein product [Prunus armeniaca]